VWPILSPKIIQEKYDSSQYFFPLLYDNPYAFFEDQYFHQPGQPETTLATARTPAFAITYIFWQKRLTF
jgi:hypothetical protein